MLVVYLYLLVSNSQFSGFVKGSGDLPPSDKFIDDEKERVWKKFEVQDIVSVAGETIDSQVHQNRRFLVQVAHSLTKQQGTTCSQAIVDTVRKYGISHNTLLEWCRILLDS
ncbi:hypothetical protein PR048_003931 [Dryococelus australis]|uniref:Uncharacterized protein n=1 Tax=Dryococelus australis TaxID=614101 RepID=A0ABQ9IPI4_9NEOP|nr:hypothetical protein PR048_003931 [Dryococelus australis]